MIKLNGFTPSDNRAAFTRIEVKSAATLDYVFSNISGLEYFKDMGIVGLEESDYIPLCSLLEFPNMMAANVEYDGNGDLYLNEGKNRIQWHPQNLETANRAVFELVPHFIAEGTSGENSEEKMLDNFNRLMLNIKNCVIAKQT